MRTSRSIFSLALLSVAALSCSDEGGAHVNGEIDFVANRPALRKSENVAMYEGSNEFVLRAQSQHRTGLDLHRNVIIRTCGPTDGVCHNQKEYPDLHTPGNLLSAIGAPCNVQSQWDAVFDGCELAGDKLQLGGDGKKVEIGYIQYITGDYEAFGEDESPTIESPGLHIELQSSISIGDRSRVYSEARFSRKFEDDDGELKNLIFATFQSQWWLMEEGTHLFAEVREYQVDRVNELLSVGVQQGDMNRNGVYGARESSPLNLLEAGKPGSSYLIGRLRGELNGVSIPGTRMPLANDPLTIEDMLALYCFVESAPKDLSEVPDLEIPIDYANCKAAEDPEGLNLLGNGATWLGRVQPLLEANCGGCHGGAEPQGGFDILSEGLYERLLDNSGQVPTMPFITPNDLDNSYLWLKLNGSEGILGQGMPIDPLEGVRMLGAGPLADIQTWITNGAFKED